MKRIVVWFWVLVVVLVARTQNNDKVDVKTFLENIKKMLQETVEKMRKQQENRMKRRKDKKNKIKTRKMLMNKLANPYVSFRRQHTVIDYKKGPDTQSNRNNPQEKNNKADGKSEGISNQTINKVLKSNPAFNPFRTDRLKDILSKIQRPQGNVAGNVQNSSTSSGATAPDPQTLRYKEELYKWFEEVYFKIDWFWDMVYKLFIKDKRRYEKQISLCRTSSYYSDSSVKIQWSSDLTAYLWGCLRNDLDVNKFKILNIVPAASAVIDCNSLDLELGKLVADTSHLGKIVTCLEYKDIGSNISATGECIPSLYPAAKLIGKKGQGVVIRAEGILPAYTSDRSLCYNLPALNFFALKNELCNVLSSGLKEEDKINYISSKAKRFILYIQFIEKIFIEKITPAIFDMCYIRCLCEDIGIGCTTQRQRELPQEEKVIIILWNIQKDGYLSFIELLPKLVSFKEGVEEGKVTICDKIQNDFKGIMGNIGKGIVGRRYKLREIKEKIDQMESRGEVDKSVYKEIIKLVEDVRRELIPVREGLIKLWQNRIESATSLDDLICVLDSFKILISNISIDNKNILELYLSDLLSGNGAKTKGLRRFIDMVGSDATLYVRFQNAWAIIWDLFAWVSALDYSIYSLITTFNILKCVIGNATIEEFLDYLVSWGKIGSDDATFLKCFMGGGKTIRQCAGERYSII